MFFSASRNLVQNKIVPAILLRRTLKSRALTFASFGEPDRVLSMSERTVAEPDNDEILVKICAAPIHPSDINTVQGVYGIKPELPAFAGNEAVGKVIACGRGVNTFNVGDMVIPNMAASGTWQTYLSSKAENFFKIAHPMSASHAAILRVNPGTALRMIRDFDDLRPGEVVIQNGSTSAVGIYVIQLAKLFGLKTINLFRARSTPEATEATRNLLLEYGATWALTDAEYTDANNSVTKEAKSTGPIKLALNCLGGKPTLVLLKSLSTHGTLLSYGAMTRTPMTVPVGPLIFQDIRLRGFWMTAWLKKESRSRIEEMLNQLAQWFSDGSLRPTPYTEIPFSDWKRAVELARFDDSGPTGIRHKIIINMEAES